MPPRDHVIVEIDGQFAVATPGLFGDDATDDPVLALAEDLREKFGDEYADELLRENGIDPEDL